jgi:hypothetical protein
VLKINLTEGCIKIFIPDSMNELIQHLLEDFEVDTYGVTENIDLLRIAEYLKIINGNEIWPIRSKIEKLFNAHGEEVQLASRLVHVSIFASFNSP